MAFSAIRGSVVSAGLIGAMAASAGGQQFQEQQSTRFPQPAPLEYTNQLAIADVNNDGALDIAWANGCCFAGTGSGVAAQRARLYMNDGAGFFSDQSGPRLNSIAGWFRSVNFGDINSNGRLDMAFANDYNKMPVLLVNAVGEITPGVEEPGFYVNESAARLPSDTLSSARVQFFDSNNNGHLDLIFVHGGATNRFGTGLTKLYLNDGDGFYTDGSLNFPLTGVTGPMDAKIGDVTGNFDLDIRIAGLNTNQSKLFINNGNGTFSNASATVPPDHNCYSYDMADINGNGHLDMLGINALQFNSQNMLIRNNGNGTWTNITSQISNNTSIDDNDSKFLDYNNNGHLDLLIGAIGGGGGERLFQNNGNGFYSITSGVVQQIADPTLDIMVADLTGDGRLDFVTAQGEGAQSTWTNRIYINVSGSPDTIPPNVVRTEQHPDTKDTAGPYVVRAFITDSHTGDMNFHHKGIYINYSHDGGPVQQVPMKFSGGTIYRGEIPGHEPGVIEYFVTAIDHNDNLGTGDTHSFTIEGDVEPGIPGDLNGDGQVNVFDLLILLELWGDCKDVNNCPADLNGDGAVNVFDLLILLENWG